jgi:hypothetical protein
VIWAWGDAALWNLDKPNLCTVKLTVEGVGVRDEFAQEFVFREFWIKGATFFAGFPIFQTVSLYQLDHALPYVEYLGSWKYFKTFPKSKKSYNNKFSNFEKLFRFYFLSLDFARIY